MVGSENDVEKQIRNMTAFIDQEANEKVEEIEAKTEEEFQIEKSKIVQDQRTKIEDYYSKKSQQIKMVKKIQNSNLLNNAKLKILSAKQEYIKKLMGIASEQLKETTKDSVKYQSTLKLLIEQGLFQLLENEVIIRCRQQDVKLVENALVMATKDYQHKTNKTINVRVDPKNYLTNVIGGVEIQTVDGKIRVVNTLDSRLRLMSSQMIPEIRDVLFGSNVNRKFKD